MRHLSPRILSAITCVILAGSCATAPDTSKQGSDKGAFASASRSRGAGAKAHPNVLFVVFDDLNRHIPPYGNRLVKAPNLERFAMRAMRFDRAYAQYPLCAPSRTSFLSGRRPEQTRIFGNSTPPRETLGEEAIFLPQYFRQNGYFSARVGKIFHIGLDDPRSWDVTEEGTPGNKVIYQPQEPEKLGIEAHIIEHGDHEGLAEGESGSRYVVDLPDEALIDNMIARRGVELLEAAKGGDKPFFVALGFRRPHLPWLAPKRYFDLYPPGTLPQPEPTPVRWRGVPATQGPMPAQAYEQSLRAYYAAISFADAQFGLLLDAMDRLGLWDDTIVVVLGDHGYHLNTRMWWGKGTPYEDDSAAPLLVAVPRAKPATSCARPVEFLDLYPTLVDLAGLPPAPDVVGRSFKRLLENPTDTTWKDRSVTVIGRGAHYHGRAVTIGSMRLIEYDEGRQGAELYDLSTDPGELHDLARDPRHAEALRRLQQAARAYGGEIEALTK